MKCPICQGENKDSAKFCRHCGADLLKAAAATSTVSQPMTNQQSVSQPAGNQQSVSQPVIHQQAGSQPAGNQQSVSQPVIHQPAGNQQAASQPVIHQPAGNQQAAGQPVIHQPMGNQQICPGCGNSIDKKAKFCKFCGYKFTGNMVQESVKSPVAQPVGGNTGSVGRQTGAYPGGTQQRAGGSGAAASGAGRRMEKAPAPKQEAKQQSSNKGLVIIAMILAIVLVVSAGLVVMLVKGIDFASLPAAVSDMLPGSEEDKTDAAGDGETGDAAEETAEDGLTEEEIEDMLAPVDELVETGKKEIEDDEDRYDGLEHLGSAIDQYLEMASAINDEDLMEEKLTDAFEAYYDGISSQVDMLDGQPMDGGIGTRYGQMVSELEDTLEIAAKIADAGFEIETDKIEKRLDGIKEDYPAKVIEAFNEFTEREQWSRTESWELMSGTQDGGMFEEGDLDDPIRLRYAYALAWYIQKENAEGVANGDKTPKAAAEYIEGLIEDTDYSPLLLREYIQYCQAAGKEYEEVQEAYDDIIQHIADTQGLNIGTDVDLEHFWYFNDFGEYSVDDVNGVTKENREWIRKRMSSVTF